VFFSVKSCKKTEKNFTRNRKLTFENMITLILQKWVKSLQLRLEEKEVKEKYWTTKINLKKDE